MRRARVAHTGGQKGAVSRTPAAAAARPAAADIGDRPAERGDRAGDNDGSAVPHAAPHSGKKEAANRGLVKEIHPARRANWRAPP